MSKDKEINTETAAFYLLDYIDNIKTEDAYDESYKKWAKHSKRNTEHHEQK